MRVLSLFDGISCGMLALERAGIPVENYDAFEIDKYAITVLVRKIIQILFITVMYLTVISGSSKAMIC